MASYADYFASGHTVRQWLHLQGYMASFNWNVSGTSTHVLATAHLDLRRRRRSGTAGQLSPHGVLGLIAIGNPLLLWGSIAAFVWLVWLAVRRRDPTSPARPPLVAALYLPWLATSRQSYIYYLTPAIPFLAILVAVALARLAGPRPLAAARRRSAGRRRRHRGRGGGRHAAVRLAALAALAAFAVVVWARDRAARAGGGLAGARPDALTTAAASAGSAAGSSTRAGAGAIVAWTYVGAVVGLALAWLPFVVSQSWPFAYYARLAWFTAGARA